MVIKIIYPEDPNLIAASSMAQPGETVVLEFDAPKRVIMSFSVVIQDILK